MATCYLSALLSIYVYLFINLILLVLLFGFSRKNILTILRTGFVIMWILSFAFPSLFAMLSGWVC